MTFSMEAIASGASFPYRWQEGYHSRVGLLPRDGDSTDVVWHDVEPCYVFHPMNAFDEPDGDGVVLDVVRHPSMFRTQLLGPAEGSPTLERWHLDGHGSAVKEERLDDRGPGVPPRRRAAGRPAAPLRLRGRRARGPTTSSAPSRCSSATTSSGGTSHDPLLRSRRQPGRGRLRAPGRRRRRDGRLADDAGALGRDGHLGAAHPQRRRTSTARRRPWSSCRSACRPASTATGCPTWPEPVLVGASAPPGVRSAAVFVWQWVQQHRLLSVLVLALVIVSSAGGTAWALVFRTVSSPVGLREALRMYRREQTGKVMATLRNRLPAPGVYTYRTSGGEGLNLMGVQRSFPSTTSMIVADGRCATVSWVPITQHTESTTVCDGPDGALTVPQARHRRVDRRHDDHVDGHVPGDGLPAAARGAPRASAGAPPARWPSPAEKVVLAGEALGPATMVGRWARRLRRAHPRSP